MNNLSRHVATLALIRPLSAPLATAEEKSPPTFPTCAKMGAIAEQSWRSADGFCNRPPAGMATVCRRERLMARTFQQDYFACMDAYEKGIELELEFPSMWLHFEATGDLDLGLSRGRNSHQFLDEELVQWMEQGARAADLDGATLNV